MNKSNSQSSFLQRNFYNIKDKKDQSITRSVMKDYDGKSKTRDLSATNSYIRDISGSKISFLNSSCINGNKLYDQNGEKLFSPKINSKSKLLSPRDRETTFYMLYQ